MSVVGNFCEPGFDLQTPFDAAVVIGTIVRPTLKDALLSVFRQTHPGRIQIMLGIDKAMGDRGVIEERPTVRDGKLSAEAGPVHVGDCKRRPG